MKRRLDEHPRLDYNNRVFYSNSQSLSAVSSSSNSGTFSNIDAQPGASNSNIPVTTSVTASTAASLNTTFHSSQSLNAPSIPPGEESNSSRFRKPLGLIQETVGSNSSLEMQNELQSSGFQAGVAGTTSQDLDHSQSSSSAQHSLSDQSQAHSDMQIEHTLESNSEVHGGAEVVRNIDFKKALSFINQLSHKFKDQIQVYYDFLGIMNCVRTHRMDRDTFIQRVSTLFKDYPELIAEFNLFVPPDCRIEVQPNQQVQVHLPDTHVSGTDSTHSSFTILPVESPSALPSYSTDSEYDNSSDVTSLHSSSESSVDTGHVEAQTQDNRPKLEDALSYVDKVKRTFENEPQMFEEFVDLMMGLKYQWIESSKVRQCVSNLFRENPKLIAGFNRFLPAHHKIKCQSNKKARVCASRSNANGIGTTDPTSFTALPGGPPSTPSHSSTGNSVIKMYF